MAKRSGKRLKAWAVLGSWGFTQSFNYPENRACKAEVKRIQKLGYQACVVPCEIILNFPAKKKGKRP